MAKSPLTFSVDVASIAAEIQKSVSEVEKDIMKAVGNLAKATHRKTGEFADEGLSKDASGNPRESNRIDTYKKNLDWEEIGDGIYVVYLKEPALWVEEGLPDNFDMKPGLLKGKKTRVIPIKYSGKSIKGYEAQQAAALRTEIDENMKEVNEGRKANKQKPINLKRIEKDANGNPIVGEMKGPGNSEWKKLHTFNFTENNKFLSWIGKRGQKGTHPLARVNVYQKMENGNVRRDIVAFRTVKADPAQPGKWRHPGLEGKKFMDKALAWAEQEWETTMLPELEKKWSKE